MTGLSCHNFDVLYDFIGGDAMCSRLKYNYGDPLKKIRTVKDRLNFKDRLLLTLFRLRTGTSIENTAFFFGVSKTVAGKVFDTFIQLLYLQFLRLKEEMFTPKTAQPQAVRPTCLKPFDNYRVTIDSTSVKIEMPYHYRQQGNTFSSYKSANVGTVMVGCNCHGAVSFVSQVFEGALSDIDLFEKSNIVDMLHPNDVIIGDRGFTVQPLLDPVEVKILIPAFLGDRERLSAEEELLNKRISAARVHVERTIRKIKCFHLLKKVTNKMLPLLSQCFYVAACLTNFDGPNVR